MQGKVQGLINDNKVMMFSKGYCPFCTKAKNILKGAGIDFHVYELDQENDGAQMQDKLKEMSGQRTVPNIYIGGKHFGGCDDLQAGMASGKVKQLVSAA